MRERDGSATIRGQNGPHSLTLVRKGRSRPNVRSPASRVQAQQLNDINAVARIDPSTVGKFVPVRVIRGRADSESRRLEQLKFDDKNQSLGQPDSTGVMISEFTGGRRDRGDRCLPGFLRGLCVL